MQNENQRPWRNYIYSIIAAEINATTKYFSKLWQLNPLADDDSTLFDKLVHRNKSSCTDIERLKQSKDQSGYNAILLNGNLNHEFDIQGLLANLKQELHRTDRIVIVLFNSYLKGLYYLANVFGWRKGSLPDNFITRNNLNNIAQLAGYQIVRHRSVGYCPFEFYGLGNLINKVLPLLPFVRWLSLTSIVVLRPIVQAQHNPGLSIIIPARNEKGNIQAAIDRLPVEMMSP